VRSLFGNTALVHDQYPVRHPDCGQAVRNDDRGPALQQFGQTFLNQVLGVRVNRRRRLVKYQYFRVAYEGPGKRETFIYINDQTFGGVRLKNFKALWTAKDTWLGPDLFMKIPAIYDLRWDPGEQYDMTFNGAAPTRGDLKSSPGRFSGSDNGWMTLYVGGVVAGFFEELKKFPNIPYKPYGPGFTEMIPPEYK